MLLVFHELSLVVVIDLIRAHLILQFCIANSGPYARSAGSILI